MRGIHHVRGGLPQHPHCRVPCAGAVSGTPLRPVHTNHSQANQRVTPRSTHPQNCETPEVIFVTPRKLAVQHDLSLSSSWRQRFEQEGRASSSALLESAQQAALPAEMSSRVTGAEATGPFAFLKRVHHVDDQPIGSTESWIPAALAPGLIDGPLDGGSLSETLQSRYGLASATVDSSLETTLATPADAQLLDTVADVPLFLVAAISRLKNGDLLEVSRTLWVGGRVRFRFVLHSQQPAS